MGPLARPEDVSLAALADHVDRFKQQRLYVAVNRYRLAVNASLIERVNVVTTLDELQASLGDSLSPAAEHHFAQIRASVLACDTCSIGAELAEGIPGMEDVPGGTR